jgi:hypothetical protein
MRGAGPHLDLVCRADEAPLVATPLGAICQRGDKLYFGIRGRSRWQYLSAVAEMRDGEAVWYFPNERGGASISIPEGEALRWLAPAVIDEDQPLGEARLHTILSRAPLSQNGVRAALTTGVDAYLIESQLVILRDD